MNEIQGKEDGIIRVRKGSSTNGTNSDDLHLVALVDRKHAHVMLTKCCASITHLDAKKRRVGLKLLQFEHGEVQKNHYYSKHAVDDNNNNKQGCLSFKESFLRNDWNVKQFGHVMSTCQTNSNLGKAKISSSEEEKNLSKAECVRGLTKK